ncbi:MAG: PilZ domain-containing protein [Phycisphaerales bacterium]|nr:MAG: PilZ domain-containing protein [Phycisphaerales bacterium]
MCAVQLISNQRADQIVQKAVERRLRAVVTSRKPQGWQTFKAEFVSATPSTRTIRLLVHPSDEAPGLLMPRPGETIGVTFRVGRKKDMFSARLCAFEQQGLSTLATVEWPTYIEQLQRRAYERVAPPQGNVVSVRFWREDSESAATDRRTVRYGQLEDLSAGGLRLRVSDLADIQIGALYKCVFAPRTGASSLIIEATLRHNEAAECGRASLGFQLIGLETTTEGRKTLDQVARVVSQYQRANLRTRSSASTRNRP